MTLSLNRTSLYSQSEHVFLSSQDACFSKCGVENIGDTCHRKIYDREKEMAQTGTGDRTVDGAYSNKNSK